jgi:hypothetical protein
MARFDWDRLRRIRPLDGADARVDPDGGYVWERPADEDEGFVKPLNARLLRAGVVVRRAKERTAASTEPRPSAPVEAVTLERCPRCHAMVSRRRMFRHARVACRGRGRDRS